jgi:cytochrome c oxidase assembly factor CtaG
MTIARLSADYVSLSIMLFTLVYARGAYELWARGMFRRLASALPAYVIGVLVTLAILEPPFASLGHALFSAHMLQHLVIMLICAPLFVLARPTFVVFWGVPATTRRWLGRVAHLRIFRTVASFARSPITIWTAFVGLFALWHLPSLYALALRNEAAHIVEHLCFFVSAYGFWSVVMSKSSRAKLDYGARALFVATAATLSGLPGALMLLASRRLYAAHGEGSAQFGLSPLEDQQIAGLLMWIIAGFAYTAIVLALTYRWLKESDRRASGAAWTTSSAVLALCLALSPRQSEASESWNGPVAGDPARGAAEIRDVGCGSCHRIPGIAGADGLVGPPLDFISRRIYLAGVLRNTPLNMMAWIQDPQKFVPGNAMPNMNLSEEQSRNITAYLYTLK